jgi:hypothetical protein
MSDKILPIEPTPIKILEERGPKTPPNGSDSWRECQILTDQHLTILTAKTPKQCIEPLKEERIVEPVPESAQESREKTPRVT